MGKGFSNRRLPSSCQGHGSPALAATKYLLEAEYCAIFHLPLEPAVENWGLSSSSAPALAVARDGGLRGLPRVIGYLGDNVLGQTAVISDTPRERSKK